jgi:hypothetical protein
VTDKQNGMLVSGGYMNRVYRSRTFLVNDDMLRWIEIEKCIGTGDVVHSGTLIY